MQKKKVILFFILAIVLSSILLLAYNMTLEQKKATPSEELETELEPGKLVLTDCSIYNFPSIGSFTVDAVYPVVQNIGGQTVHVDKILCYLGNRIGVSSGGVVEPGKEESLGNFWWYQWWENNESRDCGAINPERSVTIRFVLFENVSTEGMNQHEIYLALKEKKIGNVILEDEIVYAFENIVYEARINKSWSFNTSMYEYPYIINFETMRITDRFNSEDAEKGYKWVVFEFVIEYRGLREDDSGDDHTLQHFELEVDKGYIYDVSSWRESWLHNLSTYIHGELSLTPGETYKGEIAFEILADTEPVNLRGLGGFDPIQIDLRMLQQ